MVSLACFRALWKWSHVGCSPFPFSYSTRFPRVISVLWGSFLHFLGCRVQNCVTVHAFGLSPADWVICFSFFSVISSTALSTAVQVPRLTGASFSQFLSCWQVGRVAALHRVSVFTFAALLQSRRPILLSPAECGDSLCFTAFLTLTSSVFSFDPSG